MRSLRPLLFAGLSLVLPGAAQAGGWKPGPSLDNPAIHQRLYDLGRAYMDRHFDPAVNLVRNKPTDHLVRESIYYAYGLLLTGDPADRDRAQAIIQKVISMQDTRPDSDWRGAFAWRMEDPMAKATNPDLNSAAFMGMALANIAWLDNRKHVLDPGVRAQVDAAGKLAVGEILRRNVDPGYSNIANLSTAVAAAGASLWHMPEAGDFANGKIDAVMKLASGGALYEYSSPTYGGVDIEAAYMAQRFSFSDEFSKKAKALIDHLWKEFALSYDAPTANLIGPYGRAYGDNMLAYAAFLKYFFYLALDGNYPLPDKPDLDHGWDQGGLVMVADLPIGSRPEFKIPPLPWRTFTATGPADGRHPTRHLVQFREGGFALGTVQLQDEWKQKRNLVADWRTDISDQPGFRVGFCIDESNETLPGGFPPARILFHSLQKGGATLVALVDNTDLPKSGSCVLVLSETAQPGDTSGSPLRITDGSETVYLFPVTGSGGSFAASPDPAHHVLRVVRDWSTADNVGPLHIISYLVVFRPTGRPAPKVSDLALTRGDDGNVKVRATLDGAPLEMSFQN